MDSIEWKTVPPVIAVALAISLGACSERPEPVSEVSSDKVVDLSARSDPQRDRVADSLSGETVTITGKIEKYISPQAFRMGATQVLVVSTRTDFGVTEADIGDRLVADGTVLQVTGTIRRFDIVGFEDEFGVDYDDELFASFQDEPVIVAEDVRPLTGDRLTVAGEVSAVVSPVSFRLAGAPWAVVVLEETGAAVEKGDRVEVRGTMRKLDISDLEHEFALDLDDELYGRHADEFVLVAHKVRASSHAGGHG